MYHRNELYLAWLETWDSVLSTVEMLVEKLLHGEALPQGEITFGPPTSNSCGATSANVVVSQPLSFSSSAWLQLMFWSCGTGMGPTESVSLGSLPCLTVMFVSHC